MTDIQITNSTQHTISVTPIGTVGVKGYRDPLHQVHRKPPEFDYKEQGGYEVLPDSTVELWYDWDDINFSEIVVEDHLGNLSQFVVDPNPTQNQYHPPSTNTFTITDTSPLVPVTPDVMAAFTRAQKPNLIPLELYGWLLPWLTFPLLLWARLRMRSASSVQG